MLKTLIKGFFGVMMALMTAVAVSAHAVTFDLSDGKIKKVEEIDTRGLRTVRSPKNEQNLKQFEKMKSKRFALKVGRL